MALGLNWVIMWPRDELFTACDLAAVARMPIYMYYIYYNIYYVVNADRCERVGVELARSVVDQDGSKSSLRS